MPNDEVGFPERIVAIGVPGTRRVSAFADAARRLLGTGRVEVVRYVDVIAERWEPSPGSLLRIESPSECVQTAREILKAGAAPLEAIGGRPISSSDVDELRFDRGELLHPRQWFLGFRAILSRIQARWEVEQVRWMSRPAAIATAFDKVACLERWLRAGLPVPHRYRGVSTYGQIRDEIRERHARVFVKLRYGYSAMGAVALEWRGALVRAITTVESVGGSGRARLFVTKRPRVLDREPEIAWLIDTLGKEEIVVEKWLPKARIEGRPYDLRVVTIGGKACHVVGRSNTSPFTNLNLDARRVSREAVARDLGPSWPALVTLAEQAASEIPGAGSLGLDVLIRPCRREFALLEANAFGDYLPGLLHDGESTYEAELRSAVSSMAGALA